MIESRHDLSLIYNPTNTRLNDLWAPDALSCNDTFFIVCSLYVSERMIRDYLIVGNCETLVGDTYRDDETLKRSRLYFMKREFYKDK